MKAYLWVALACAGAVATPAIAGKVRVGEGIGRSDDRGDACQAATESAWSGGASSIGECRCGSDETGARNFACRVTAYAYQADPVYSAPQYNTPQWSNPYSSTTVVLPGQR